MGRDKISPINGEGRVLFISNKKMKRNDNFSIEIRIKDEIRLD